MMKKKAVTKWEKAVKLDTNPDFKGTRNEVIDNIVKRGEYLAGIP